MPEEQLMEMKLPLQLFLKNNRKNIFGAIMKILLNALVFLIFIEIPVFSQSWQSLNTISSGNAFSVNIALDNSGIPYVVYSDGNHATVKKYSCGSWGNAGNASFSISNANYDMIAIDANGTPYVVYQDMNCSKATVMNLNGSTWANVGSSCFTSGNVNYTGIAINSSGIPYIVYKDYNNSSRASVMKYSNSSWSYVGTSTGFSSAGVYFTNIAIDGSGTPYVVYEDAANSYYATVMKYNGSNWVTIGSAGFSAGQANYTSIAIDGNGTPYVVYQDAGNNNYATVMKYNGSSWVNVGSAGFTGYATYTNIAIDRSNNPYVVFKDGANGSKVSVMKFNGSNWVTVGSPGFSANQVYNGNIGIAIDVNGVPYIVYTDGSNYKGYVMVFSDGKPDVFTASISNITGSSASGGGNVSYCGTSSVTARGVCWGTSSNPTISSYHTTDGSGSCPFTSSLSGLSAGVTYHVRAYATNTQGTAYGNDVTFTTLSPPTVTTSSVTNITANSATGYGDVTVDNGSTVTSRGVCWNTSANPTISPYHTTETGTTGTFSSNIMGLSQGTIYHVRAYATNAGGTAYGDDVTFTTLGLPTVSTASISNIQTNTASSGGNVTADGGISVTARGVCWSTSTSPSTALSTKTTNSSGTGTFWSNMTNLTDGTTYFVRAYATNSVGTAYGSNVTFTTLTATTTTVNTASSVYGSSTPVILTANVSPSPGGGTATFKIDGNFVGSGNVTSGSATYSYNPGSLSVGTHQVTSDYSGYSIYGSSSSSTFSFIINQKLLSVNGATVTSKIYDANTNATISGGSLVGIVGLEDVSLATISSGTFNSASVGNGKTVTTSMTITGANSGNYVLTQPSLSGNITAKALSIIADNKSKCFDGSVYSGFTVSYSGFTGIETPSDLIGTLSFTGTATTATGTGTSTITPGGLNSLNYDISYYNGTLTINPIPIATIAGSATVCSGAAAQNITFTGAGGSPPYTFIYKVNSGSNQFVTTVTGNSVMVPQSTNSYGTFIYTLVSIQDANSCSQSQTGCATILVRPRPAVTVSGSTTIITGQSTNITFTLTGTPPWNFTYTDGSTTTNVTNLNSSPYLITVSPISGATTYTNITYHLTSLSDAYCTANSSDLNSSATVRVNPRLTTVYISPNYSSGTGNTPAGDEEYMNVRYFNNLQTAISNSASNSTIIVKAFNSATSYTYTGNINTSNNKYIIDDADFILNGSIEGTGLITAISSGYLSLTPTRNVELIFPLTDGNIDPATNKENDVSFTITCLNAPSQNVKIKINPNRSINGAHSSDFWDITGQSNLNATVKFKIPKTTITNGINFSTEKILFRLWDGERYMPIQQEHTKIDIYDIYYIVTITGINRFN